MVRRLLWVLVLVGVPVTAPAATYYVATTGNDTTGNGSLSTPWRNPQKCVMAGTPLVAGDTCIVKSGTYTNPGDGSIPGGFKGRVVVINASSPVATVSQRITIKSEVRHGAILEAPDVWPGVDCNAAGTSCPFSGIYMSGGGSYYTIEGFQFTRPGSSQGTNGSSSGITILTASTGVRILDNDFHDIARTVCSNSIYGNVGIFATYSTGLVVERNVFRTIGRLRNGESGCSTSIFQQDHGVYLDVSTDATIQQNLFYDVTRGFAIDLKARFAGTKTLRATVQNNTFSGDSPTTVPRGQIILVDLHDGTVIRNNIFNDPEDGYVVGWGVSSGTGPSTTTGAGIAFTKNLSNSTRAETSMTNPSQKPTSGITYSGNIMNTSPGFVNAAANDFRLSAGSAAIDAGVDVGLSWVGAGPDIGALEFGEEVALLSVAGGRFYMAKSLPFVLFPIGEVNAPISLPTGAVVAVAMQVRCANTAACGSRGYRLTYLCAACASGGTQRAVPIVDDGDFVELWGSAQEVGLLTGPHAVNLTGSEPHIDGQTYWDSATTGLYDLPQNSSTVLRWLVEIRPGAPSNAQYCFKVVGDTGEALGSHTPSGGLCVAVGSAAATAGP